MSSRQLPVTPRHPSEKHEDELTFALWSAFGWSAFRKDTDTDEVRAARLALLAREEILRLRVAADKDTQAEGELREQRGIRLSQPDTTDTIL